MEQPGRISDESSTPAKDQASPLRSLPRKRNRVACVHCHQRKVRCDVTLVGEPCTNCRLDRHECTIPNSGSRRARRAYLEHIEKTRKRVAAQLLEYEDITAVQIPDHSHLELHQTTTPRFVDETDVAEPALEKSPIQHLEVDSLFEDLLKASCTTTERSSEAPGYIPFYRSATASSSMPNTAPIPRLSPYGDEYESSPQMHPFGGDVIFSYFDFLELKGLSKLKFEDIKYLELRGSLHVPRRSSLEVFIHQYFLRVHPCTPVVDEAQFWQAYKQDSRASSNNKISLLVFQAMLFAASPYVPVSIIKTSGFSNFLSAHKTFHNRTRLLYDFRTEPDATAMAQATLLLSYYSPPQDTSINTLMLSLAIHHARAAKAHIYAILPRLTERERSAKKRLWWACVVRDRIIALGVRRPLQITPDHFDVLKLDISEQDFEYELNDLGICDRNTKRRQVKEFLLYCKFAAAVTPTLSLLFPLNCMPTSIALGGSSPVDVMGRFKQCKDTLGRWLEEAQAVPISVITESAASDSKSIGLLRNLIYAYYYTAEISLLHHRMAILSSIEDCLCQAYQEAIGYRSDILQAMTGLNKAFIEISRGGMIGFVPITLLAYAALPLFLMSLDLSLSASETQKQRRYRRLNIYSEIYKACHIRFDYVQVVLGIIKGLLKSADFSALTTHPAPDYLNVNPDKLLGKPYTDPPPKDWSEVLFRSPLVYFRVISRLDRSLSSGQYAVDESFITNTNEPSYSSTDRDAISMEHLATSPSSLVIDSPRQIASFALGHSSDDANITSLSDSFDLAGEILDWTAEFCDDNGLFS